MKRVFIFFQEHPYIDSSVLRKAMAAKYPNGTTRYISRLEAALTEEDLNEYY